MLLMVEKGIRGGIVHAIHSYAKASSKYMKNYQKDIGSLYFMYLDVNNSYGWGMSQNLPVNGFKWIKNLSKFDEDFIKYYDSDSDKGYILEVDVEYPKNLHGLRSDLPFFAEKININESREFVCNIRDKENCSSHESSETSTKSWINTKKSTQ